MPAFLPGTLLSALLALISFPSLAGWQPALTANEQATATSLALQSIATRSAAASSGKSESAQTRNGNAGNELPVGSPQLEIEVLLVEVQHSKKNRIARIAEVFVFDYQRGVTELHRVNMENDEVIEVIEIASPHLPLNSREQQAATALAVTNDQVRQQLETEYQRAFGRALTTFDEIDMKVSVWQPQPHQSNSSEIARTCDHERCALISVFTRDNYSFSLEPVVNLMQNVVYPEALQ